MAMAAPPKKRKLKCLLCPYIPKNEIDYQRHYAKRHKADDDKRAKKYKCPVGCRATYHYKKGLKSHMRARHPYVEWDENFLNFFDNYANNDQQVNVHPNPVQVNFDSDTDEQDDAENEEEIVMDEDEDGELEQNDEDNVGDIEQPQNNGDGGPDDVNGNGVQNEENGLQPLENNPPQEEQVIDAEDNNDYQADNGAEGGHEEEPKEMLQRELVKLKDLREKYIARCNRARKKIKKTDENIVQVQLDLALFEDP